MPIGDHFWSDHFARIATGQVAILREVLDERILPTFEAISEEAEKRANDVYKELGNMPAYDDGFGMADAAEWAQEEGLARYEALSGVRQAILNALTVALYHLFEQQLLLFLRRHVLHPSQEGDSRTWSTAELFRRLEARGLDVKQLPQWPRIHELHLTANTLKHADGRSADELHTLRPDLFLDPFLRGTRFALRNVRTPIYAPMAGDDLFVSEDDFRAFTDAVTAFYNEFADAIRP